VETEEILVKVVAKTFALIGVNVHVVMVRVIIITVGFHTLDEHLVNDVGWLWGLFDFGGLEIKVELLQLIILLLKLLKEALLGQLLNRGKVLLDYTLDELLQHHSEMLLQDVLTNVMMLKVLRNEGPLWELW
jgi:hypothetical protein